MISTIAQTHRSVDALISAHLSFVLPREELLNSLLYYALTYITAGEGLGYNVAVALASKRRDGAHVGFYCKAPEAEHLVTNAWRRASGAGLAHHYRSMRAFEVESANVISSARDIKIPFSAVSDINAWGSSPLMTLSHDDAGVAEVNRHVRIAFDIDAVCALPLGSYRSTHREGVLLVGNPYSHENVLKRAPELVDYWFSTVVPLFFKMKAANYDPVLKREDFFGLMRV